VVDYVSLYESMVLYFEADIVISDVSCFQRFHVVDYGCDRRFKAPSCRLGAIPSLSLSTMDGKEIQHTSKRW